MVEPEADLLFALEHRPRADAAGEDGHGNLDDDRFASVLEVLGLEDGGHPAAPDFFTEQESSIQGLARSHFQVDDLFWNDWLLSYVKIP